MKNFSFLYIQNRKPIYIKTEIQRYVRMVGGGGESIVLKPSKIILSYMDISKTVISSDYEVPTMGQVL